MVDTDRFAVLSPAIKSTLCMKIYIQYLADIATTILKELYSSISYVQRLRPRVSVVQIGKAPRFALQ
jgi:hypothetical protein